MLFKDKFGKIVDNDELNTLNPMEVEERQLRYCEECVYEFS